MSTIHEYQKQLEAHDWTYMMSDDHRVYVRGESAERVLLHVAAHSGDEFKRAFNKAYAAVFHREPFACPYSFPFPDVLPLIEIPNTFLGEGENK